MLELFQQVYQSLQKGQALALATIIGHRGSTPRTSGAGMVVRADGTICGTIGGGKVEGEVIDAALRLFDTHGARLSSFNLTQTGQADDMDLVCGGEMQVLIEFFPPDAGNLEMFRAIEGYIASGRAFYWLGRLTGDGTQCRVARAVCGADGDWSGSLLPDPGLRQRLADFAAGQKETVAYPCGDRPYLIESLLPAKTVCLMGAGHVAKEIARLTRQVGFKTLVFDDRAEFANREHFPDAEGVFVCNAFAEVFGEFDIPAGSYIVIITRGHRHDKEVLAQALHAEAEYIGMIGSRKKKHSVYQSLLEEGFERAALEQVHCPIGLEIDAETPAEIAVSVAAELIRHRARALER